MNPPVKLDKIIIMIYKKFMMNASKEHDTPLSVILRNIVITSFIVIGV